MVAKLISPKQPFVIAMKDGKEVNVNTFEPEIGLACGCTCPKCGKPVISNVSIKKNLKRKFTNHFSHHDLTLDSICSGIVEKPEQIIKSNSNNWSVFVVIGLLLAFINRKRIMRFFGWY